MNSRSFSLAIALTTVMTFSIVGTVWAKGGFKSMKRPEICAQVITFAQRNKNSECQLFGSPCEVPPGWKVCSAPPAGLEPIDPIVAP